MQRNSIFVCPCCNRDSDLPPSVLTLQGNYGSQEHDTERATIKLCGSCYDLLYSTIRKALPAGAIETEFTL